MNPHKPEEAVVCNYCGTKYSDSNTGINKKLTVARGHCWCCHKDAQVSPIHYYDNLPLLPKEVVLYEYKDHARTTSTDQNCEILFGDLQMEDGMHYTGSSSPD